MFSGAVVVPVVVSVGATGSVVVVSPSLGACWVSVSGSAVVVSGCVVVSGAGSAVVVSGCVVASGAGAGSAVPGWVVVGSGCVVVPSSSSGVPMAASWDPCRRRRPG